jgi:hypothetical protein
VRSQREYLARFDPYTVTRFAELPAYSPERAAIYREHASKLMRHWRTWFGFGSIIFGMSVAIAFNVVEYYVFARLLLLNPLFYFYMRPEQRRASQAAFAAM